MPAGTRLDAADVDAALSVVGEAASSVASGSHPFDLPVIERLAQLVGADRVGFFESDTEGAFTYSRALPTLELDWAAEWVREVLPAYPLNGMSDDAPGGALRLSDLVSRAGKLRNAWYVTVMRPCLVEHEMKLWLRKRTGAACGLWFTRDRGSSDFNDRAASVMTTLRPHLTYVLDRWQQHRRFPHGITTRETEILALLRDGYSNREIAARLVISPHTVRTHLEHIFEKLEVHTRTAAVRRAYGASASVE